MGRRRKKNINKEETAEGCCFVCKDGGLLRICDYKDCLKAYHPQCLGKDDSFLESEVPWNCKWHFCLICKSTPKFHCFCCSKAVCGGCLCDAEFVVIRTNRGLCHHCLTLLGLIEGVKDPEADEGKIDFSDEGTYEFMFRCYWDMIRTQECLTSEHIRHAVKLLNEGRNCCHSSDSNDIFEREQGISDFADDNQLASDYDDMNDIEEHEKLHKTKRKRRRLKKMERLVKSQKKEFIGWCSKPLFDFLASIGRDATHELTQNDVTTIITDYCKKYRLFHPEKRKKILCDSKLKSLLGRKSVNKNGMYRHLAAHFAENFEHSEDELASSSEDNVDNVLSQTKRQQKSNSDRNSQKKEAVSNVQQSCLVSVISQNIKLVYLRRSLVEELSKQPGSFEAKVTGSLVRVKSDPNDYLQKNPYHLLPVIGIKRTSSTGEINSDVHLQVSNMLKEIRICKLSDDNFSEEECDDLCHRVKDGLLKWPTVVEFREKARTLHEVITKHWIARELGLLQKLINQANEKGWRRELSEYIARMKLLQTPAEQSRLLHEVPEIIVDETSPEPTYQDLSEKNEPEHNAFPEFALRRTSKNCKKSSNGNWNDGLDVSGKGESSDPGLVRSSPSHVDDQSIQCPSKNALEDEEEEKEPATGCVSEELYKRWPTAACQSKVDSIHQGQGSFKEVMQNHPESSVPGLLPGHLLSSISQCNHSALIPEKQNHPGSATSNKLPNELADIGNKKVNQQSAPITEVTERIELSDDEEHDASISMGTPTPENLNTSVWFCMTPHGVKGGPYSLSLLKEWSCSQYGLEVKVWKSDQDPEEAVPLTDAIHHVFARK